MAASYSDVLFAKLALQQRLVTPEQVQECVNAQEAGRRAHVEQPLGHVMIKRGYLTRYVHRQLETARDLAERSRHAKLAIQLLLRHGRPGEDVLREEYGQLKRSGFPSPFGDALVRGGHLSAGENQALNTALGRAWSALYQRERRELREALLQAQPTHGFDLAGNDPRATFERPLAASPYANNGTNAGMAAWSGGAGPYASPGYGPPGQGAPGQGAPGYGAPGYGAPAYGAPGFAPPRGGPVQNTGFRRAAAYPQAPPAGAPGRAARPGGFGQPTEFGGPLPQNQAGSSALSPRVLPPSPSPWRGTAEVRAFSGGTENPQRPRVPQVATTSERVAHMNLLPDWAMTRERPSYPGDAVEHESPSPSPEPTLADAAPVRKRKNKLKEPTGSVPGYEYSERLGRGKVGVVYKARELATGKTVALKVLLPIFMEDEALVERFRREAKIAASLDHPNIRKVHEGGERGGLLYLAMEYIDGETLQDKIDREGRLSEDDCLRWIAQIARAMSHYDKRDILHRDVKPANILISKDRRALLCDLGISKKVYEDYALTKQGTTLGSPWYISPEQGMGTDDLDIRSDMYSLGITLFHCLTGRVPFLGRNAGVIISKHAREPLPDPQKLNPDISTQAVELLTRMCTKMPDDRPQTPSQLLAEIQWIRTEVGGGVNTPISPIEPPDEDSLEAEAAEHDDDVARPGLWRRFLRGLGLGR